jgi:hypothetical protein
LPFISVQEAEARLRTPAGLSDAEVLDLLPWMPQLSQGPVARLQAHLGAANVRAVQNLDQTTAKIEGAITRMDAGSTALATRGLNLNYALFIFTVVFTTIGLFVSALGIWIAIKSYKAADASANQQQQTLDASRRSLDTTVETLKQLTSIAATQQRELAEYQKKTLAKPEFAIDVLAPFEHTKAQIRKVNNYSVTDLSIPYGKQVMLIVTIRNTGGVSAHDVTINVNVTDPVEDVMSGHPEYPKRQGLTTLGQYDYPVFYSTPTPMTFTYAIRIKADTPDYMAQMSVNIDGNDLQQHYQKLYILRNKSAQPEGKAEKPQAQP